MRVHYYSQASGACLRASASGHQRRGITALFAPLVVGDQIPRGQATVRPAPPACAPAFLCASHGRTSHHTLAPHACAIGCRAGPRSCSLELIYPHTGARNVASCWRGEKAGEIRRGGMLGRQAGEKRRARRRAGETCREQETSRRRAKEQMAGEKWRGKERRAVQVVLLCWSKPGDVPGRAWSGPEKCASGAMALCRICTFWHVPGMCFLTFRRSGI